MYVNPCDCYNPDQIVLLLSWYNVLGLGLWCLTSLSVLLVKETGVPGQVTDKLISYYVVSSTSCHERGSNSQL